MADKEAPLGFDMLHTLRFEYLNRVGPLAPIMDHRICAGLLFERWNDSTTRRIEFDRSRTKWPKVVVTAHRDFSDPWVDEYIIHPDALKKLKEINLLEEQPFFGGRDPTILLLNEVGQKMVVTEWFLGEGRQVMDVFAAGAAYDTHSHRLSWDA